MLRNVQQNKRAIEMLSKDKVAVQSLMFSYLLHSPACTAELPVCWLW